MATAPPAPRAITYVRLFVLVVGLATAAMAGFNALGEAIIAHHPQARSLQMLSAFARVIKPAWLAQDRTADTVIIGNSRIRDGFDPVLIERDLHLRVFNYGVSGGTAYEAYRYAQDALARPQTRTVIFGAAAFSAGSQGQPIGFGFEETRLAVTAAGAPTTNRGFWLAATRYLSGGALGLHVEALSLLSQLGSAPAQSRPDLFSAYLPMTPAALAEGQRHHAERSVSLAPWNLTELNRTLDLFCGGRVRAILFFEPDHFSITAAWAANDELGLVAYKTAVVEAVERHNRTCGSRIQLYDFMRLNQVTGEAIAQGVDSRYYREAVHFRPTTGLLILRRMLGLPGQLPGFGEALTPAHDPGAEAAALRNDLDRWRTPGATAQPPSVPSP